MYLCICDPPPPPVKQRLWVEANYMTSYKSVGKLQVEYNVII